MLLELFVRIALHTNEELAYAAGFIDGEGHIRIQKHSVRGSYMLSVSAVQSTETPLPLLQKCFGGVVKRRVNFYYRGQLKIRWEWQASSKVAERALKLMLPYLRVKKDEAEVALEFRKTFRPQYGDRYKNPPEVDEKRKAMMYSLQDMRKAKRAAA